MTAPAIKTSHQLDTELGSEVFPYGGDVSPPSGSGGDLPPPPALGVPLGPLTRLVRDIFGSDVHGSPSAPVLYAPDRFRRAAARRTSSTNHPAMKGTA